MVFKFSSKLDYKDKIYIISDSRLNAYFTLKKYYGLPQEYMEID